MVNLLEMVEHLLAVMVNLALALVVAEERQALLEHLAVTVVMEFLAVAVVVTLLQLEQVQVEMVVLD
jgi:hypothetical protein